MIVGGWSCPECRRVYQDGPEPSAATTSRFVCMPCFDALRRTLRRYEPQDDGLCHCTYEVGSGGPLCTCGRGTP